MKTFVPFCVALVISGVVCIVAAYFCHFYYVRYQGTVTDLEFRISSFDQRLGALEAHKARELTPVRVWGIISTSDRKDDEHLRFYVSSERHSDGFYEAIGAKDGPLVRPELRLPVGSTTNCEYTIQVESQFGVITDAWLSHAQPYQELASFEEFRVSFPRGSNVVRLIARPRANASIQMRFELVILSLK